MPSNHFILCHPLFPPQKYLKNISSRVSQVALVVKNSPSNTGGVRVVGSIAGLGRSPGGGNGNLLQYSCLGNSMDRGAWWALVHRVAKSQTQTHAQHIFTASVNEIINIFFQLIFVGMWEPFHVCILIVSKNFARLFSSFQELDCRFP